MSAGSKPNDARREECQAAEAASEPSRRSERDSPESPVTPLRKDRCKQIGDGSLRDPSPRLQCPSQTIQEVPITSLIVSIASASSSFVMTSGGAKRIVVPCVSFARIPFSMSFTE